MSNMRIVSGALDYTMDINPSFYQDQEIAIETNERMQGAKLLNYNNGIYHIFSLSFDNIGTAQEARFGTFYRQKKDITFYPMDENKGTSVSYVVRWVGDFNFTLSSGFWAGGYQGQIVFEQV